MKFLTVLLLFVTTVHAERISTRIHSIDRSTDGKNPHLIKFENGRVGFVSSEDKASLTGLFEAHQKGEWMEADLDRKGNFLGASQIAEPKSRNLEDPDPRPAPTSYTPTNLSSLTEATAIFGNMRRSGSGQCYNRAHVWTYEEFNRSGLCSMKLFMFFTRSYIYQYRYKWWFHVTPMTYVNGTAMTLDRAFFRGPATVKTWTDNFIYSKRNCPVINKYSSYRDHQDTEHCYLHPATMYFWQPRDLENYELTGYEKKQFNSSEISHAYWNAF